MGERLVCNQEAIGSIPFTSTILLPGGEGIVVKRFGFPFSTAIRRGPVL